MSHIFRGCGRLVSCEDWTGHSSAEEHCVRNGWNILTGMGGGGGRERGREGRMGEGKGRKREEGREGGREGRGWVWEGGVSGRDEGKREEKGREGGREGGRCGREEN